MKRFVSLILSLLFGLVGCDSGYKRDGAKWVHNDYTFTPQDPATFKAIDKLYARDSVRGYYRGSEVFESDGASFEVVSEHEARDRNAVYYCDTYRKGQEYWSIQHLRVDKIPGADPATYRSIGRAHARDKQRVYFEGVPFKVRDFSTFEPFGADFGRDSQVGYHARKEIAGSHGPSFATIDERDTRYARDRSHVYYGYVEIDDLKEANDRPHPVVRTLRSADPATIRILGRDYASDPAHVWYRGLLIAADAKSFAVRESFVGNSDASDNAGSWGRGKRVAEEPQGAASAASISTPSVSR